MIRFAIFVDNLIHSIARRWVRFCCKRLNAHWPVAVYVSDQEAKRRGLLIDPTGGYSPHFDGYKCELCGKPLNCEKYSKTFTRGRFLWARGLIK